MKFIRKRWRGILISTGLITLLGAAGLIFWAGLQIASPSRRPLMDYLATCTSEERGIGQLNRHIGKLDCG